MSKPEYDEFFYKGTPEHIVELKDALVKGRNYRNTLSDDYDRSLLFCPECHNGQLKFTPEYPPRRAFLSFIGNGETDHAEGCSHKLPVAGKRETKEYYDSLTDQQIENKLNAAINRFLRHINPDENTPEEERYLNHPAVMTRHRNGEVLRKRLLTRSVYSIYDINDDELNIPILLYGNVKLSIDEHPSKYREGEYYYYLNLIDPETEERIRYFYRGTVRDNIDINALYHVTIIAVFKRNPNGKLISDLYTQNAITYIEI